MERREGWLGYIALGVGVLALIVALSGRFSGPQVAFSIPVNGGETSGFAVPSAPVAPVMPTAPAPPDVLRAVPNVGPSFEQSIPGGRSFGRGENHFVQRFEGPGWQRHGWGFWGIGRAIGGIAKLAALVLLGVLLLRFLRRRGRGPWGGRGRQDAHWHGYNPHPPAPPAAPTPPTPPAAPPSPPQTGQTIQF